MPISKPTFQSVPVQDMTRHMDKLASIVDEVTAADGSVDMQALEAKVRASDDGVLQDAFERVKMSFREFSRDPSYRRSSPVMTHSDPARIEAPDVQSVMGALIAAKTKLAGLDKDRDGKLDQKEAAGAGSARNLADQLVSTVVHDAKAPFLAEMESWQAAARKLASSVQHREALEGRILLVAERHAETPRGAEAIAWAYRALAVAGQRSSVESMDRRLSDAETGFWSRLFGASRDRPHLDDGEVGKMLGTSDLAGFIAAKRSDVDAAAGGSYDAWLKGKDLDGVDALQDPDFRPAPLGADS